MKRTEYDRDGMERELAAGAPLGEDDAPNSAKDFSALHKLISGAKLTGDADVQTLRNLVNDHNRQRLHQALDRVLDRVQQRRRCAGDRAFLGKLGIRP